MDLGIPRTIEWLDGKVKLINQLKLPWKLEFIETRDYRRLGEAIKRMEIRGAPALGVAAAYGLALAALQIKEDELKNALKELENAKKFLEKTRPTAVNLFWALNRIYNQALNCSSVEEMKQKIVEEAKKITLEDEETNKLIGVHGNKILRDGDTVITVCNAGSLATSYYGTVLSPIYTAKSEGKEINVIVMETRPYLQGARLTAWELQKAGINVKVITDNSIGIILEKEKVDLALVGADRITKEGYVVNKIGTYPLALVCRENKKPFYSVAPTSTIDLSSEIKDVEIEKRPSEEVTEIFGKRITPEKVEAIYYAFDITPPSLLTGIITEKGILKKPFPESLKEAISK